MTDVERAEQALGEAGFERLKWVSGSEGNRRRSHVRNQPDGRAEVVRVPYDHKGPIEICLWIAEEHLAITLTAPALVQTLMDALKPFASLADQYAETWASFDFQDHDEVYMHIAVGHFLKALSALTAVETAKLPRMYTLEEIRKGMAEVQDQMGNRALCHYTAEEQDGATFALNLLAERLQGPQKGGATT